MYLTRRQRQILDFIKDFIAAKGYSPSLEEIGAGVGLSSLATVHVHLRNIEKKGLIRRRWN
ncbi:MAG: repressor LexA, partial [bacterium]